MTDFIDYCKQYILDHLEEYAGQENYGCDWGYRITEIPNINGTLTFSKFKAKEYLKFWWDDCADYWQYEVSNFGQNLHNPFEETESFMVCMVIYGVNFIMSQAPIIQESWDESLKMDEEVISSIKEFVKEFD